MKTSAEFAEEINGSKELLAELKEIKDKASLQAFLKANGCTATAEEFAEYIKSQSEGEIGDDAAEDVAGGRRTISEKPQISQILGSMIW